MNSESTENERALMARIFGLQAAVNALLMTHPDPAALRAAYEQSAHAVISNALSLPWSEAQVDMVAKQLESYRTKIR